MKENAGQKLCKATRGQGPISSQQVPELESQDVHIEEPLRP